MKARAAPVHPSLAPVCKRAAPAGDSGVDWLLGSVATIPLAILAVELIVDVVLLFVGLMLAATVFLLFVTLAIYFVAVWLTVGLSILGAVVAGFATTAALIAFLQQRRQQRCTPGAVVGLAMGLSGLTLHALAIAAAIYCHVALFG